MQFGVTRGGVGKLFYPSRVLLVNPQYLYFTLQCRRNVPVMKFTHIEQETSRPSSPSQDRYGQLIEPMGLFVTVGHHGANGLTDGRCTFRHLTKEIVNPLIVKAIATEEHNAVKAWKVALSERYTGKVGQDLTSALIGDGYDAILTVDESGEYGECVLLK
jgi:hypothetical protein